MFVLDLYGLNLLQKYDFFNKSRQIEKFIEVCYTECLMSCLILQENANIACMIFEYQNMDFRKINTKHSYLKVNPVEKNMLFGDTMHPFEFIFHKNNGNLNNLALIIYTNMTKPTDNLICHDITDLKLINNTICFTICIATYKRVNGTTPTLLNRCLNSINKQSYTNYRIVIIGDKYEPESELENIIIEYKKQTNDNIILLHNNCVERDFIKNKLKLWKIAGAKSMNVGLEYCRTNTYPYYCHLDDDDYWDTEHLKNFAIIYTNYTDVIFINSISTHPKKTCLPKITNQTIYKNNILPLMGTMCHSSISFRCDIVPYNYFTTHNENEIKKPSDGLMLNMIREFSISHNYACICTNKKTCFHETET